MHSSNSAKLRTLRIAVLALLATAAGLAVVGLLAGPSWSPAAPGGTAAEEPPVAPVAGQVPQRLTLQEAEEVVLRYLALTTWLETTMAAEEEEKFKQAWLAEPNLKCATEYRRQALAGTATQEELPMQCATAKRNIGTGRSSAWDQMSGEAKEATARQKLLLMWDAISPEGLVTTTLAFEKAALVTRNNQATFADFASDYDHCQDRAANWAPVIAATTEGIHRLWDEALWEAVGCAGQVTEGRFLPPPNEHGEGK